ncbi:MAG: transposase, partial [Candidatus Saccharicenans sp.]
YTNILESTNREIRRRNIVVGVFPLIESYLRLVTAYLIECTEDWANENAYIKADKLEPLLEQELAQAAN